MAQKPSWRKTKRGDGWHGVGLAVAEGLPAAAVVKPASRGTWFFGIFGRGGARLHGWSQGHASAEAAMAAAEEIARTLAN